MAGQTLTERAINKIIDVFVSATNRRVNIGELQKKYKAEEQRLMRMTLRNLGKGGRSWHFRVADGKLLYVSHPTEQPVGGFDTTSDVLMALLWAKRKMQDPATGKYWEAPYTPLDAITHGDVRIWGAAAANDVLLVARHIYKEVFTDIQAEVVGANGSGKHK